MTEGQREIMTDLEDRLEKAQAALEQIAELFENNAHASVGALANLMYDARCIARSALQSIPATKEKNENT